MLLDAKDFHEMLLTFIYSGIGILVFTIFFLIILKVTPFPVIKEIEEDQNVALSILIGAAILGLSIIIVAAIVS